MKKKRHSKHKLQEVFTAYGVTINTLQMILEFARDGVIQSLTKDVVTLDKRFTDETQRLNGLLVLKEVHRIEDVRAARKDTLARFCARLQREFPRLKQKLVTLERRQQQIEDERSPSRAADGKL